ncbi:Fe2OG dioxygenase domain-containing protein [Mycena chlorophos]|uniref:Fe2OG dioxygenase domain-containing protein n=1 Tax=Mycena chlorophos TaxID=658473 RepID=A0A8H6TAU6_MYCCL|nr:Fe2OG dioxygenase domain-containing protein [Mycena chlorophos]
MGKNSKKRKQPFGVSNAPAAAKKAKLENDGDMIGDLILLDELDATTDTLTILAQNPDLISLKALKPLRTAIHDYWRVANGNAGSSLTARISSALVDHRHIDALVLLSEMELRGQVPKLGALQRWVRECDAVLDPSMSQEEENLVWRVLNAILRTTQPQFIPTTAAEGGVMKPGSRLRWFPPFSVEPESTPSSSSSSTTVDIGAIKPLHTTPGPERRPPNKHPAVVYYGAIPLFASSERKPQRFDVPGVPGGFIINDVFDPSECKSLIEAAETVGMLPDEPTAGSATQLASVLAHNFIWLADESFIDTLYQRVVDFLPQKVKNGAVRGINRRFRLYRYRPGALYRPHIDGAWPASGMDSSKASPSYIYDSDPSLYSRLTFLIYLNDNFDGGCTTFFLPGAEAGIMDARPVRPRTGTVCVFPHGAALGSLLHEGSGVTEGAKYVIRTEVLYEVDASERVDGA